MCAASVGGLVTTSPESGEGKEMKLLEVKTANEFASTFFADPVLKMAVNAALDNAPGLDLVRCKDCRFYSKDTVSCSFVTADTNWYEEDFCSYGERKENNENECCC